MFDVGDRLDELRCWPTGRLVAHREDLVREQRRLHVEELTALRVLDERGRVDDTLAGRDGVSTRSVREALETARGLEALPAVAAAAWAGDLSAEQLAPVVALADESSDVEWAQRAPHTAPGDLARLARTRSKPTVDDSRARYAARGLRMWWTPDKAMLHLHGQLPDVMGAKFEATIQRLSERAKPPTGRRWDSWEHRAADALVGLCDPAPVVETPSLAAKPLLVVSVPLQGPADVAGIPLADAMLEQLRANATIEPVLVDDHGLRLAVGKRTSVLSPKIVRAVLLRDGHCRIPGCAIRHGLQIHHLRPRSWAGTDNLANLTAVCVGAGHHQQLVPHGPWALVGNPNQPDGLRLVHLDQLTRHEAQQLGLPPPSAGPDDRRTGSPPTDRQGARRASALDRARRGKPDDRVRSRDPAPCTTPA